MHYISDYNGEENGREEVRDQDVNKTKIKNKKVIKLQLHYFPLFKKKLFACLFFFHIKHLKLLFLNM